MRPPHVPTTTLDTGTLEGVRGGMETHLPLSPFFGQTDEPRNPHFENKCIFKLLWNLNPPLVTTYNPPPQGPNHHIRSWGDQRGDESSLCKRNEQMDSLGSSA